MTATLREVVSTQNENFERVVRCSSQRKQLVRELISSSVHDQLRRNPVRLEQRMGRIHRYGQEKDCLILNFVSTNTREGRVLHKLFERLQSIESDLDPQQTGKIFNVLGDVFASNQIERMLREMYTRNLSEDVIKSRIVEQVDGERFR